MDPEAGFDRLSAIQDSGEKRLDEDRQMQSDFWTVERQLLG